MMQIKLNRQKSSRPKEDNSQKSGMDDKIAHKMGCSNEKYDSGFLSDTMESWNKINLKKVGQNNKTHQIVDMYLLKLTSIIVCRGEH